MIVILIFGRNERCGLGFGRGFGGWFRGGGPIFFFFVFEIRFHPLGTADAGFVHGVAVDDHIGNFVWLEAGVARLLLAVCRA